MSTLLRYVASAVSAAAMVAVLAAPVSADSPATSNGSGMFAFNVTSVRNADGNTILGVALNGTIDGTFSGNWNETGTEIIHRDGSITTNASGTFTVSVIGCGTGKFAFSLEAQGAVNGAVIGRFRSIDEASATIPIHTVDAFHTTGPMSFVYSGMYSC
jgi:hypothetical protein